MIKKNFTQQLKVFMTLCLLLLSTNLAWGNTTTSTFTDKDWNVGEGEEAWTAVGAKTNALESSGSARGVQVTLANIKNDGLTLTNTSIQALGGISKVEIVYSSNCSGKSDGTIAVAVGTTDFGDSFTIKSENNATISFENPTPVAGDIVITFTSTATSKSVYVKSITVTYEGGTTPSKELISLAVSGAPDKTTYKEGEEFDPTGLTVTGTYSDATKAPITSGITWDITPSGALEVGTTSVDVTATVSGITSPTYVVNGLTVTEKPALPSYKLVTDASILMNGDVIVLGAEKDGTWYANGGHSDNNKFLDSKGATYEEGILESSEAVEITLEKTTDGWYLKLGDEYINTTAAKALTFADEASTVWTIGIDENKLATVAAGDYGRFLYNASNPRFLNYTSDLNVSMLLPQIFKKETAPASADVTITSVGWATACVPFNATISDNATAYYVTTSGSTLNKVEANVIPAGAGVLLKSNDGGAATVTFTETTVAADEEANYMLGSVAGETFSDSDFKYYILANDSRYGLGFYFQIAGGVSATCAAGKAVLAVPAEIAGAKVGFPFDEEPTGIESLTPALSEGKGVYNLNGVRVNENYNGIVIVNGKKYLNK